MLKGKSPLAAVVFLFIFSLAASAWGQGPEAIKRELGEKEKQLWEIGRQEKLISEELDEIDRSLEKEQRELRNLSQELDGKIARARSVEARIGARRGLDLPAVQHRSRPSRDATSLYTR